MGKDQLASVIVEVFNRGKSYGEGPTCKHGVIVEVFNRGKSYGEWPTCKQGVLMLMEKPVRMEYHSNDFIRIYCQWWSHFQYSKNTNGNLWRSSRQSVP